MSERAHKWFWFTALGSIAPLLIFAIILVARDRWSGFPFLIERGELFLISAVLLASSIGDLFTANTKMRRTKMAVLAMSLVLGVASAVWYAVILDCLITVPIQKYSQATTVWCSVVIFAVTLLMGLACVMLSSESEAI